LATVISSVNTTIEKNTSHCIMLIPSVDLSDYTLVYLAKKSIYDADEEAVIAITPTIETKNVRDLSQGLQHALETETVVVLLVTFQPAITKDVTAGTYLHFFRAISDDEQTVIPLFDGKLVLKQNGINQP
jgi:hypothetical protein